MFKLAWTGWSSWLKLCKRRPAGRDRRDWLLQDPSFGLFQPKRAAVTPQLSGCDHARRGRGHPAGWARLRLLAGALPSAWFLWGRTAICRSRKPRDGLLLQFPQLCGRGKLPRGFCIVQRSARFRRWRLMQSPSFGWGDFESLERLQSFASAPTALGSPSYRMTLPWLPASRSLRPS